MSNAEHSVYEELDYFNDQYFEEKGLRLTLTKRCCTSWLEFNKIQKIQKEE